MNFGFKPDEGQEVYYVTPSYEIGVFTYLPDVAFHKAVILTGNYYETVEEAEDAAEGLRVKSELALFAYEANEAVRQKSGEDPTVWDTVNNHYYVFFDVDKQKICVTFEWDQRADLIYFPSSESALQAVVEIGAERILQYYFKIDLEAEEEKEK